MKRLFPEFFLASFRFKKMKTFYLILSKTIVQSLFDVFCEWMLMKFEMLPTLVHTPHPHTPTKKLEGFEPSKGCPRHRYAHFIVNEVDNKRQRDTETEIDINRGWRKQLDWQTDRQKNVQDQLMRKSGKK